MPRLIIIAGPKGAGKTTFASECLSIEEKGFEFVNADEIARAAEATISDVEVGRQMFTRIDELVRRNADFVIETTLASLSYARKIPVWRQRGFRVELTYLCLPSVQASLARVRKRVAAGATAWLEEAIERQFAAPNAHYLHIHFAAPGCYAAKVERVAV